TDSANLSRKIKGYEVIIEGINQEVDLAQPSSYGALRLSVTRLPTMSSIMMLLPNPSVHVDVVGFGITVWDSDTATIGRKFQMKEIKSAVNNSLPRLAFMRMMSNHKTHTTSLKGQNPPTSLDSINFKSMFDELTVKVQLSMKETLSEAIIDLKSKLKLYDDMIKVRMKSCVQRVDQIKENLESRLVAVNAEINTLHRMVNRSNLNISGFPKGLNDIPGTAIKTAEYYSVTTALHHITFIGYIKNKKKCLNSILIRDDLMSKYFKNIKVWPLYAVNCAIFTQEILRRRIYLNDHLCPVAAELNKACASLPKKGKHVRFRIVNDVNSYAILISSDGREGDEDIYIPHDNSFKITFEEIEYATQSLHDWRDCCRYWNRVTKIIQKERRKYIINVFVGMDPSTMWRMLRRSGFIKGIDCLIGFDEEKGNDHFVGVSNFNLPVDSEP
uniref:Uncharacterized protein n=1 Tax=Glossina palpalis gambiensis TaxID=67801 RepID=A0A1B0C0L9_9MUSC